MSDVIEPSFSRYRPFSWRFTFRLFWHRDRRMSIAADIAEKEQGGSHYSNERFLKRRFPIRRMEIGKL